MYPNPKQRSRNGERLEDRAESKSVARMERNVRELGRPPYDLQNQKSRGSKTNQRRML